MVWFVSAVPGHGHNIRSRDKAVCLGFLVIPLLGIFLYYPEFFGFIPNQRKKWECLLQPQCLSSPPDIGRIQFHAARRQFPVNRQPPFRWSLLRGFCPSMPGAQALLVFCPGASPVHSPTLHPGAMCAGRAWRPAHSFGAPIRQYETPHGPRHQAFKLSVNDRPQFSTVLHVLLFFLLRAMLTQKRPSPRAASIASNSACRASAWLFNACFSHSGIRLRIWRQYPPVRLLPGKPAAKNRWRHPLPPSATPRLRPNPKPNRAPARHLRNRASPYPRSNPPAPAIGPIPEGPVLSPLGQYKLHLPVFPFIVLSFRSTYGHGC